MKVFLVEDIHPEALAALQSCAEIVSDWNRIGEVDAILNRNLRLGRDLLSKAPSLKVIAIHGTGSDCVDMEYCRAHGITVAYVPFQNSDSVAELLVGMTLALLRKICMGDRMVKAGEAVQSAPAALFGAELVGKTVGFIGTGDIAVRTARIFREGFRARVIGYSPSLTDAAATERGLERRDSIEAVLREADVICPCVHLTPSTEKLLGEEQFSHCKPGAVLVNASRGGVVDEDALYRALTEKRLAGAACDVWREEPPAATLPLVQLPNVIALPHIGANTDEALRRVGMGCVRAILDVFGGNRPQYVYE